MHDQATEPLHAHIWFAVTELVICACGITPVGDTEALDIAAGFGEGRDRHDAGDLPAILDRGDRLVECQA